MSSRRRPHTGHGRPYKVLVGAGASVVRAAIMGSMALVAQQIGRRAAGLNTLARAAWGMTAPNPPWRGDVGFQLSAGAAPPGVVCRPHPNFAYGFCMPEDLHDANGSRTCLLFPFRLSLLILSFRGTLEALQGIFYAGSDCFRAKCFEKPTPPAWREDEVSAILDAAGGRIDGSAGNVWLLLQAQWEKSMQVELVSFGIDLFDLEGEAHGAAKSFSCEVDGLACGGWTFWLTAFYPDIGPIEIAFPLYEVVPDHFDRRRDDCDGTD